MTTPSSTKAHHGPLRGLANVRFHARDLAAARAWYAGLLGEPYFERPGYIEFRTGDDASELGILDAALVSHLGDHGAPAAPCGAVAYWHVDDVPATLARLAALGAAVHERPRDFGGGFVVASVRDPFGNVLGLMHSPHWLSVRELRGDITTVRAHPDGCRGP